MNDRIDHLIYELRCLEGAMTLACRDFTGTEDPCVAHFCQSLHRIVEDLYEAKGGDPRYASSVKETSQPR